MNFPLVIVKLKSIANCTRRKNINIVNNNNLKLNYKLIPFYSFSTKIHLLLINNNLEWEKKIRIQNKIIIIFIAKINLFLSEFMFIKIKKMKKVYHLTISTEYKIMGPD